MARLPALAIALTFVLTGAHELHPSYRFEASNMSFVAEYLTFPYTARSVNPTLLTDPPTEQFVSHSQSGQDLAVLKYLNNKKNGYFVDLAANHWSNGSNSFAMEHFYNWTGICIEPNPVYLEGLLTNRKCKVFTSAVGIKDGEKAKFRYARGGDGLYGGVVGPRFDNQGEKTEDKEVTLVSLTTLLDFAKAPAVMDYLSLDVEGAEFQVVKGLDHSKYTFHIATVERPKPNTHHVLIRAGYRFLYQLTPWGETIYLHRSIPNFTKLMQQYRQTAEPGWMGSTAAYLLHPAWDQEYPAKREKDQ